MKTLKIIIWVSIFILSMNTFAQNSLNEISNCLLKSISDNERKSLAKWAFFSMAAHPEIKSHIQVSPKDTTINNQIIGNLFTKLLTSDCGNVIKMATEKNPNSFQYAFTIVGELAMQEIISNSEVQKALLGYMEYTDIIQIQQHFKNSN